MQEGSGRRGCVQAGSGCRAALLIFRLLSGKSSVKLMTMDYASDPGGLSAQKVMPGVRSRTMNPSRPLREASAPTKRKTGGATQSSTRSAPQYASPRPPSGSGTNRLPRV